MLSTPARHHKIWRYLGRGVILALSPGTPPREGCQRVSGRQREGVAYMRIAIEVTVRAPLARVWSVWTTPDDIMAWNATSDDWH